MNHDYTADYLAQSLEDVLGALDAMNPIGNTLAANAAIRRLEKAKSSARETLAAFYAVDEINLEEIRAAAAKATEKQRDDRRRLGEGFRTVCSAAEWRDFDARR